MLSEDDYNDIISQFPPIVFAFSYGSGAIEQGGYTYDSGVQDNKLPMLDFIFAVENAEEWHRMNLESNPEHYTSMWPMNAKTIACIQDNLGSKIWYYYNLTLYKIKYLMIIKKISHTCNYIYIYIYIYILAGITQ
jgi:translocator assembly and maintenance protein 41